MSSLFLPGMRSLSDTSSKSTVPGMVDNPQAAAPHRKFALKKRKDRFVFDRKDVPYPLSFDSNVTTLDVLDHLFIQHTRDHMVSWVDFKNGLPKRCLDIGCGVNWVMEAAKQWKDCHFVGFDIVPTQPGPTILSQKGIADRVQWVNGNFLKKMPFEDNSFDHIHIYRIAWGVAEDCWDGLFAELARILRPGGAIEVAEEDIYFPILPPSYTVKLKPPPPTPATPATPRSPSEKSDKLHAHALLESLFFGVFASRGINTNPTSIIHHYLNIHFRNVATSSYVVVPMPPPPVTRQNLRRRASTRVQPSRKPDSTTRKSSSTDSLSSLLASLSMQGQPQPPHVSPLLGPFVDGVIKPPEKHHSPWLTSFEDAHPLYAGTLSPPTPTDLADRGLSLHLNSMFRRILGCKGAMWEELRRRLHLRNTGGPDLLSRFGWDDVDDDASPHVGHGGVKWSATRELEVAWTRFEEMTVRFEKDMLHRTALADAIEAHLGWKKPPPDPLSKFERMRQRELNRAIAATALAEPEGQEQQTQVTRSFKGWIGFKIDR